MKLIYCSTEKNSAEKRLRRIVDSSAADVTLEIYQDIHGLSGRLCQPKHDVAVAVLLAGNRKALLDFLTIRNLLLDVRIILILPERDGQTISMGHKLLPRFVSYTDSNFSDVGAVLEKMISKIRQGEQRGWQLSNRMEERELEACQSKPLSRPTPDLGGSLKVSEGL